MKPSSEYKRAYEQKRTGGGRSRLRVWLTALGISLFAPLICSWAGSTVGSVPVLTGDSSPSDSVIAAPIDPPPEVRPPARLVGRNLSQYYARRQYPGSPPVLPHPEAVHGKPLDCLLCHADGGWTAGLRAITPKTPHPQQVLCWQCHVRPVTDTLFRGADWKSIAPPSRGRAYLPGAPPAIPHDLQMRSACRVCHVGPGTVAEIRMQHPSRWGSCRQCHVPDPPVIPFQR